jgi:hypothetical protein
MISENSAQNEKFHATLSELLLTSAQVRRELSKSRESVRQLKHIVQTWKGNNLHEADDNKTLRKPKSLEQGVRAVLLEIPNLTRLNRGCATGQRRGRQGD